MEEQYLRWLSENNYGKGEENNALSIKFKEKLKELNPKKKTTKISELTEIERKKIELEKINDAFKQQKQQRLQRQSL